MLFTSFFHKYVSFFHSKNFINRIVHHDYHDNRDHRDYHIGRISIIEIIVMLQKIDELLVVHIHFEWILYRLRMELVSRLESNSPLSSESLQDPSGSGEQRIPDSVRFV